MANRRVILVRPEYNRQPFQRRTVHQNPAQNGTPYTPSKEGGSRGPVAPSQTPVNQFLEQLTSMSVAEQKELLDKLSASLLLASATDSKDRDLAMWSEAVHERLTEALGGGRASTSGVVVTRKLLATTAAWSPVRTFVDTTKLSELRVVDRQAVYMLLADLLVRHARSVAQRSGAPFSAKLVANCTVNLPGLFDAAFPGYIEAGLVRVIARQWQAKVAG